MSAALAISPASEVKTPVRAKVWHNVVTRLADEGVPVRAIVRSLMFSYEEVQAVITAAIERGLLLNSPRDDWDATTTRNSRQPERPPLKVEDDRDLVTLAMRTFGITPSMAKIFALLLRRREASKKLLHSQVLDETDPTDEKIIDVFICKMRKKLPDDIKIETVWGVGYYLLPISKERAFKRMGITHDTLKVPPQMEQ